MPAKILIIEDEEALRENMVDLLTMDGYIVIEAADGREGMLKLRQEMPDVVLCDIALPEFNGYDVLEYMRETHVISRIPFIFVTARVDRTFIRHGMESGADDYITKPFSDNELLAAVRARLKRYQSLTEYGNAELEKAKKRLTQMVSHELRTPLVSIAMVQELVSKKLDALSPDDIQELMQTLKSGNQRLSHVVEQMVLMTQIDTEILSPEDIVEYGTVVPIWSQVEAAVETARKFAYRHSHGQVMLKSISNHLPIKCHTKSLHHAFAEIIANALDFSPTGTRVIIAQQATDIHAQITVVDNGPGMTTNRLRLALQPYEQLEREKREQQGMGLGLPLAKKIIELHGGNILFRTVASGGTQAIIQIPHYRAQN